MMVGYVIALAGFLDGACATNFPGSQLVLTLVFGVCMKPAGGGGVTDAALYSAGPGPKATPGLGAFMEWRDSGQVDILQLKRQSINDRRR